MVLCPVKLRASRPWLLPTCRGSYVTAESGAFLWGAHVTTHLSHARSPANQRHHLPDSEPSDGGLVTELPQSASAKPISVRRGFSHACKGAPGARVLSRHQNVGLSGTTLCRGCCPKGTLPDLTFKSHAMSNRNGR